MSSNTFALLEIFKAVFEGRKYEHRNSTHGDLVASQLYEDLVHWGKSTKLAERVKNRERVVNVGNKTVGKKSRRGDGTFGELVPTTLALTEGALLVARGKIANIEIGAETKILAKAMIKQIDRVIGDLVRQVEEFRKTGGQPICVGIVGVNFASAYTSYEGDREWPTDGKTRKHPAQEAAQTESRVLALAKPAFDEFLVLRFKASNVPPFPFEWVNHEATATEYSALLVRLSREYDRRFL